MDATPERAAALHYAAAIVAGALAGQLTDAERAKCNWAHIALREMAIEAVFELKHCRADHGSLLEREP